MSFWAAAVITNIFAAIPAVGDPILQLLRGGFAVDNPTLNRFFSLHYLLPFVILADADAAGKIDWNVSVDATICRAHQHGTNTTRPEQDTGGRVESQEPALPGL